MNNKDLILINMLMVFCLPEHQVNQTTKQHKEYKKRMISQQSFLGYELLYDDDGIFGSGTLSNNNGVISDEFI
jgi:hypothetical protein